MAAFEPYAGERKGRAWDAATRLLRPGEWVHRDVVVDAMVQASDLQRSTCEQVLTSALQAGWLRRAPGLRIKTTEAGTTLRPELRPEAS